MRTRFLILALVLSAAAAAAQQPTPAPPDRQPGVALPAELARVLADYGRVERP